MSCPKTGRMMSTKKTPAKNDMCKCGFSKLKSGTGKLLSDYQ